MGLQSQGGTTALYAYNPSEIFTETFEQQTNTHKVRIICSRENTTLSSNFGKI